jgi:hypothetical protein
VIYLVPTDPTTPLISFSALRQRAKRLGYRILSDRYAETFSLIDAKLNLPISGLEHVAIHIIANVLEAARVQINKRPKTHSPAKKQSFDWAHVIEKMRAGFTTEPAR